MITFERNKDIKQTLDIGVFGADREFETRHKATLWFFNNYKVLFPDNGFFLYGEKLYLPIEVYHKLHDYLLKHVTITLTDNSPFACDEDYAKDIPDLIEDMATEIYERCKRSKNRSFPIPVNKSIS